MQSSEQKILPISSSTKSTRSLVLRLLLQEQQYSTSLFFCDVLYVDLVESGLSCCDSRKSVDFAFLELRLCLRLSGRLPLRLFPSYLNFMCKETLSQTIPNKCVTSDTLLTPLYMSRFILPGLQSAQRTLNL